MNDADDRLHRCPTPGFVFVFVIAVLESVAIAVLESVATLVAAVNVDAK